MSLTVEQKQNVYSYLLSKGHGESPTPNQIVEAIAQAAKVDATEDSGPLAEFQEWLRENGPNTTAAFLARIRNSTAVPAPTPTASVVVRGATWKVSQLASSKGKVVKEEIPSFGSDESTVPKKTHNAVAPLFLFPHRPPQTQEPRFQMGVLWRHDNSVLAPKSRVSPRERMSHHARKHSAQTGHTRRYSAGPSHLKPANRVPLIAGMQAYCFTANLPAANVLMMALE